MSNGITNAKQQQNNFERNVIRNAKQNTKGKERGAKSELTNQSMKVH